ncbi:LOW QUALITY PROTEIN: hypothetical protein MSG28_006210 [Choristoneura fumiferana]|uniref:Uncharacterized protein n=1 Tax=Choristoneura fumiferana TaxID=7141 RepID=A0ACC0JDW9_CHOFU|nr:LOW QUALITY PROTEIN: hypothetical protein MSG28_006210 [Choristoneura fumiferana]
MWRIICMTLLAWLLLLSEAAGQEYLPPKIGGAKKPAAPEPTLPANYDFSYDVQDSGVSLDFGHNEKRKDDRATGSYHVLLPDGRMQLVEYEAGPDGYKPQVRIQAKGVGTTRSRDDRAIGHIGHSLANMTIVLLEYTKNYLTRTGRYKQQVRVQVLEYNEKHKDDRATDSYSELLPDGRMQLVEYEAGPDGYESQVFYPYLF